MSRRLLWITGFVFGIAGSVLAGVGGTIGYALLIVAVVLLRPKLNALAGLLTGFGGFWLFMMSRQLASGGELDNLSFWLAVGAVPLAVGLALTGWTLVRVKRAQPEH